MSSAETSSMSSPATTNQEQRAWMENRSDEQMRSVEEAVEEEEEEEKELNSSPPETTSEPSEPWTAHNKTEPDSKETILASRTDDQSSLAEDGIVERDRDADAAMTTTPKLDTDVSEHQRAAGAPEMTDVNLQMFAGQMRYPMSFLSNPFMAPVIPHLPQTQQQNSAMPDATEQVAAAPPTTEDWRSGYYFHPQYYQELLQQYLRNMTLASAVDAGGLGGQKEPPSECSSEAIDSLELEKPKVGKFNEQQHQRRQPEADNSENIDAKTIEETKAGHTDDGTGHHWNTAESVSATRNCEAEVESCSDESPLKTGRNSSPYFEDGLSSEQSDTETDQDRYIGRSGGLSENPAALLIKKQISEIEKQILRRAQNENIRKMDPQEIEAFLMEQQRTLEANLFESATNTGAWTSPSLHWHQDAGINWERVGAEAAARQFQPNIDTRSLMELAAAAKSASTSGTNGNETSNNLVPPNRPVNFVQAHFPQNSPHVLPAMYAPTAGWPGPFFAPGSGNPPINYRFSTPNNFIPPAAMYGGIAHPYLTSPHAFYSIPPSTFASVNGHQPPSTPYDNETGVVSSQTPRNTQKCENFDATRIIETSTSASSSSSSSVATPLPNAGNASLREQSIPQGRRWSEEHDEQWQRDDLALDQSQEEPVWVLRESYVRKLKREEERQALREQNEAKQLQQEKLAAERAAVESDIDNETDKLLGEQRVRPSQVEEESSPDESYSKCPKKAKKKKEVMVHEPAVLIEGVLFRARYLGSTQLICDGRPTKATRMMQAQEAVSRIKAPDGEQQPSTDVDLFISTEKIMVLNTDLQRISDTDVRQDIMMDHPLRTISYIADIGDLVVLMARRMSQSSPDSPELSIRRTPKLICHVFESEESQFIAQSIGQAFQVAYIEFLRANGIEDPGYLRDVDYQEVLNAQEIFGEELEMFARKETQKDVVVPKQKNELLGVVIVESGWGSMLPTVVIANLMPGGPAARSNQLNIGDHIIALNGISFVGLPLAACQNHIKNVRHLTAVKLTVVHTPPVVEVRIKRPETKYQLGFSVQNGVICSLLRGGIAERGGVRVGHRIIEINSQSVVAVPHERIVTMLATAVGEIQMKTMPTSMFRLLTGQETPAYI